MSGAVRGGRKTLSSLPLPRDVPLRLPALALSGSIGRGLRRRDSAHKAAQRWWALHALDAMLWTLALATALGLGVAITWL